MAFTDTLSTEESRIAQAAEEAQRVLNGEENLPQARAEILSTLRKVTVEAPLHSLAVAFLLGIMIARRR